MTTLLVVIALSAAGAEFVAQDLSGVRVSAPDPLTGRPSVNYRRADLTGDGRPDLLFEDRLVPGRMGPAVFADATAVSLPQAAADARLDVWGREVWFLGSRSALVAVWDAASETWQTEELPHDLPEDAIALAGFGAFSRFLHDLNGDGAPEVVWPLEEGLALLERRNGSRGQRLTHRATLAVYPPRHLRRGGAPSLWPVEGRRVEAPVLHSRATLQVMDGVVRVMTRVARRAGAVRYSVQPYRVTWGDTLVRAEAEPPWTSPELPEFVRACRLNADGVLDFAGSRWELSPDAAMPTVVSTTVAWLGATGGIQRFRAQGFRPQVSFVDMDGDGDADLVTETSALTEGGIRESLARFLTARALVHRVDVRMQDGAPPRFASTPERSGAVAIGLAAPAVRGDVLFQRYRAGELVNLTGDFDADGLADLAVQDRPDRIAVYPARGDGFGDSPLATVPTTAETRFSVADVDGDGRSDVIFRWLDPEAEGAAERSRVYLCREGEAGNLGVVVGEAGP